MMVPWWDEYTPKPAVPMAQMKLRKAAIERYYVAKGMMPGSIKYETVVRIHYIKCFRQKECKWDTMIPPLDLELAKKGIERKPTQVFKKKR